MFFYNQEFELKNIKVVVFDFNGTLLDDLAVAYGSVKRIFETYNLPSPTVDEFREEITADLMEFYFRHGFARDTSLEELNTIRRSFYESNWTKSKIRPDVEATLKWLSGEGFYTAIVSAERPAALYRYLLDAKLQRRFDCIMSGAWGPGVKQKYLMDVAEIFSVTPGEIVYVDDTVDGLTQAKNAGVVPVAFTNPTGYNSADRLVKIADFGASEISHIGPVLGI